MSAQTRSHPIADRVPAGSAGAVEIGFSVPEHYNASDILFANLMQGRGERLAVTGPYGQRTYAELCVDAARFGNALLSLGLRRGDRVLMFLDDTPVYPAAFFGAVRAGLVPLLIRPTWCSSIWPILAQRSRSPTPASPIDSMPRPAGIPA